MPAGEKMRMGNILPISQDGALTRSMIRILALVVGVLQQKLTLKTNGLTRRYILAVDVGLHQ
jgi:hypothetical protein